MTADVRAASILFTITAQNRHRNLWPHYDCNFSVFRTSHIYSPATGKVRAVTISQAVNFDRLDGALLLVSGAVSMTRNTKIADVYLSQRIVLTF